jgi:hypothetical protein
MANEFKQWEGVAEDPSIEIGDLILLKEMRICNNQSVDVTVDPVFYAGPDTYVSDGKAGIEKGTEIHGARVYGQISNGKPSLKGLPSTVCDDRDKGRLIRYNHDPATKWTADTKFDRLVTHQYALAAKAGSLSE